MKISRTLTNEELTEKVLKELEDFILDECDECVEAIDKQLRKGATCLDPNAKLRLREYLRGQVNLNLTINVGIQTKDLDKAEVYPVSLFQQKLDKFEPKKEPETKVTFETGENKVTLTQDHIKKLDEAAKALKEQAKEEDETHRAERKRRSAEAVKA